MYYEQKRDNLVEDIINYMDEANKNKYSAHIVKYDLGRMIKNFTLDIIDEVVDAVKCGEYD